MTTDSTLITVYKAKRILGVSSRTVRRWIEADRFPGATDTDGFYRLPLDEVEKVADERRLKRRVSDFEPPTQADLASWSAAAERNTR